MNNKNMNNKEIKKEEEVILKLKKYFNIKVIGSYLLYDYSNKVKNSSQILSFDEIGDIDIVIDKKVFNNVITYMKDEGFEFIKREEKVKKFDRDGYPHTDYIEYLEFRKEGYKTFDITVIDNINSFTVYSIKELIKEKAGRCSVRDLDHIIKYLNWLKNNNV